jgi:hypothetical protein
MLVEDRAHLRHREVAAAGVVGLEGRRRLGEHLVDAGGHPWADGRREPEGRVGVLKAGIDVRPSFVNKPENEVVGGVVARYYGLSHPAAIDCAHVYVGGPVKAGITPMSQDEMYLFLLPHVPDNPRPRAGPHCTASSSPFGGALGAIREQLVGADQYRPLEKLLPPPWHRGRAI